MIKNPSRLALTAVALMVLLASNRIRAEEDATTQVADLANTESGAANLLLNPGFEEGDQMPRSWSIGQKVDGVTFLWDKQKCKSGNASICLKKDAKRYFPIAEMHQVFDRKDGSKSIKVSAQVKAEGAHKAVLDVLFLDKDSEWISHHWVSYIGAKEAGDEPVTHDWKEYAGEVEIPPTARKIQVSMQIYGPGKVWFDDVTAVYRE
ncbi:hypothetical protein [Schlesneria sp. T3-172]|uniref:hypothetical protein n=1 Tax=Schlesneria sphaerica TaxID=3373610 RepID=UPI0037C7B01E